jgi:hypothetical protein
MMRGASTRNYDKPSKLQAKDVAKLYPKQTGEFEKLIEGSMKLAAALYLTKKVYRPMTQEELDEFERYARGAVKVKINKKGLIG